MRIDIVERLFSLFTTPDRAASIAGDLAEERERRGSVWFWMHVVRITFALWRSTTTEAPLRILALSLATCVALMVPALAGRASVFLFPQLFGSAVSWISLSIFWCGGALWTGASVAAFAPRRGVAACAILALVGAVLLLAYAWANDPQDFTRVDRMFFTIALGASVSLLAGAAIARRVALAVAAPFAATVGLAATLIFLIVSPSSTSAQQGEWRDPSPHVVSHVPVDTDVQLEVLDWGGSGPALVLLAGAGATAHQYDDLAPALAARYRVVGLTRRGHRGSTAAPDGYGHIRLAEDVMRVIEAMAIENPVVIGHSFAGEEMHVLGARYSGTIRGLIYVDAAFDRGDASDSEAFEAVARMVPTAPSAEDKDLASFAALRAYLERYGARWPEAYMRTRYRTNPDGTIAGLWAPDVSIRQAMADELRAAYSPYDPEPVRVPALAIYAVPKSADDLLLRGSSDRSPFPELVGRAAEDPDLRANVKRLYLLTRERVTRHEIWFKAFAERGQVVELSGTHDLIVSNPREVLEQIEGFMSSLPPVQ